MKFVVNVLFTPKIAAISDPPPTHPPLNTHYQIRGKTESQQQLNPATKFPVAAGLASTAHDAGNMLEKLPVGTMAGILRVQYTTKKVNLDMYWIWDVSLLSLEADSKTFCL